MTIGVSLNGKHCLTNLGMYLTKATIKLPEPQTRYISVPGRDGDLDLSTALDGETHYQDRDITLTFETTSALSQKNWPEFLSSLSNLIHGAETRIVFDGDSEYFYTGRGEITAFNVDGAGYSITMQFVCSPYKLKHTDTVVTAALTDADTVLTLTNQRRPVVPVITVDAETLLTWDGGTCTVSPGAHSLTALRLTAGSHTLKARTVSGAGTITITYREGSL